MRINLRAPNVRWAKSTTATASHRTVSSHSRTTRFSIFFLLIQTRLSKSKFLSRCRLHLSFISSFHSHAAEGPSASAYAGDIRLARVEMVGGPDFKTFAKPPTLLSLPPQHSPARYVAAMKDSWSSDDRRDRGRVDRGVHRQRRSRSPTARRHESDRESREIKGRDRSKSRSIAHHERSTRDRSHERRRRTSRSPRRDPVEAVREKNRGRELLLDTRGSDKSKRSTTHPSPSPGKRRKSRSPSPPRSQHKRSRRVKSQSPPPYPEGGSSRPDRRHRAPSPLPPRRRSPERPERSDRRSIDIRGEGKSKHHRDSGAFERRGRSPSPRQDRPERHDYNRRSSASHRDHDSRRNRSPPPPAHFHKSRERSPYNKPKDKERKRDQSPKTGRQSPEVDRYEPDNRSRQQSPGAPRGPRVSRGNSPKRDRGGRPPPPSSSRDEYRPGKPKPPAKGGKPTPYAASGANSIEVKGARSAAASGANSVEVKSDKMAGRGYYQQGYNNPHNQMQAAFPLKPQYNQGPQVDPRYSQSPQHHMTPNSYHGSPQAQSPYGAGRGNWNGQQQFSPPP